MDDRSSLGICYELLSASASITITINLKWHCLWSKWNSILIKVLNSVYVNLLRRPVTWKQDVHKKGLPREGHCHKKLISILSTDNSCFRPTILMWWRNKSVNIYSTCLLYYILAYIHRMSQNLCHNLFLGIPHPQLSKTVAINMGPKVNRFRYIDWCVEIRELCDYQETRYYDNA